MGLIIYVGVIGNALLPFLTPIRFHNRYFSLVPLSSFFFCFEGLENRHFTADFMETKKNEKKKIFFAR